MVTAKMRRDLELLEKVAQHSDLIERWYNRAAIKFMHTRMFKDNEERLLEEITDFFLNNLENADKEADKIGKELQNI